MPWFQWLQLVQGFANAYAISQGKDVRALGYLQASMSLITGQQFTNEELDALREKYAESVASGTAPTHEELSALSARLQARSALIQE